MSSRSFFGMPSPIFFRRGDSKSSGASRDRERQHSYASPSPSPYTSDDESAASNSSHPISPLFKPTISALQKKHDDAFLSAHSPAEDDASSQVSIPLDSDKGESDIESGSLDAEGWDEVDPAELGHPKHKAAAKRACRTAPSAATNPTSAAITTRGIANGLEKLRFDDESDDTVLLSLSDQGLDWDSEPFDYSTPFGQLPHESYGFEEEWPNAAPILRHLASLSHSQRESIVGRFLHSRSICGSSVSCNTSSSTGRNRRRSSSTSSSGTAVAWRGFAAQLDNAIKNGKLVVNGAVVEAKGLKGTVEQRILDWGPALMEAVLELSLG